MEDKVLNQRDIDFMLYELFDVESLNSRTRYADHSRETFNAAIDTGRAVAFKHFLPIRSKIDAREPTFDGERVQLIPEIKPALDAVFESGLATSTLDYESGGMQLPMVVANAAQSYLSAIASTTLGYITLTGANANLIEAHGTEEQIKKWVVPMREGRFMGTMAMTEPGAGSGLADITTSATRDECGVYRIFGNKIFISGGDHDLSENIVHLVLARIKVAPKGVKGISLFIVPKYLVDESGKVKEKNDVSLAGLFHKMGGKGHTSTALSFGEGNGAIGYLVGEENKGLSYMFHMMNEARIIVGTNAALTALTGFQYSLSYARERPQGRLLSNKDPDSSAINIIEHPDVRRMLLAQKAYSEGAYALCLYGSLLADNEKTAESEAERKYAKNLLDFLTPIIKSWPSEYGLKANHLAIQVLGGHGYINEHPVEMFYRDNRLNPIHEGTTGIQSLDLLCRKVPSGGFSGYKAIIAEIELTIDDVKNTQLEPFGEQLSSALSILQTTTSSVYSAKDDLSPDLVFSNSVSYLEMFGHIVIAWMWLRQGIAANQGMSGNPHDLDMKFYLGKIQAMKFFFRSELPKIHHWSKLVSDIDSTSYDMRDSWF
ncbi:acyl-CoA dehydrogenase [Microbulbifer sp. SH-1]|uniref:acyl-CoA dehydrogenase n=1 Tax=Microbulbifer sp. SH-1 TaxID=2681547 RepID=UPI00140DE6E1|nr:acyl-CoA dehydrogenase [Microbulbifer sp. SH-1]QIL91273.1 acyl-CoA dehydrogenase [Microbulbifer sp. SH-1]